MEKEQNLDRLPISLILLDPGKSNNSVAYLKPLAPEIISVLEDNPYKEFIRIVLPEEGDDLQVIRRTATAPGSAGKPV